MRQKAQTNFNSILIHALLILQNISGYLNIKEGQFLNLNSVRTMKQVVQIFILLVSRRFSGKSGCSTFK